MPCVQMGTGHGNIARHTYSHTVFILWGWVSEMRLKVKGFWRSDSWTFRECARGNEGMSRVQSEASRVEVTLALHVYVEGGDHLPLSPASLPAGPLEARRARSKQYVWTWGTMSGVKALGQALW